MAARDAEWYTLGMSTQPSSTFGDPNDPAQLYIDLMKKSLSHSLWLEEEGEPAKPSAAAKIGRAAMQAALGRERYRRKVAEKRSKAVHAKVQGQIWPQFAHTMIGLPRLENLQFCVQDVLANNIPGDLIETGVWRGGACIFMRAILKAYGVSDRTVWVADSFAGLPAPDTKKAPADWDSRLHRYAQLAVPLEKVQANFQLYGLLDTQVRFLKGWFKDTLPTAPIQQLAVARLDGDMYESTMDALQSLYPKLSVGGYLIVDDYGAVPACKQAVEDYRLKHGIREPVRVIDWTGVYWQRLG